MKKTMRQSICALLSVVLVLALLAPGAAAAGDGVFYTFPEAGIAFLKVPEGMTLKVEDMHDGTTGEAATNAAAFTITDASGDEMLLVGMGMPNQRLDNADESVNPVTQEELVLQLMHDMEVYQDITSFSQMTDEDFTAMVDDYNEIMQAVIDAVLKDAALRATEEELTGLRASVERDLYRPYICKNAKYLTLDESVEIKRNDEETPLVVAAGTYITLENQYAYIYIYFISCEGKELADNYLTQIHDIIDSITYAAPKTAETAAEATTEATAETETTAEATAEEPAAPVFKDMEKHWAKAEVGRAVEAGLFSGVSEDSFSPDTAATRAQLVTALYRMAGSPETGTCDFTDVKETDWFAKAVAWAAEQGIVQGSDGKFNPYGALTREELAVMLQRFARSRGYAAAGTELVLDAYKDQDKVSSWAAEAMRWAVSQKLINGMTTDTLVPAGTTTRAQLAVILMRYLDAEPNFAPAPDAEIPAPAPAETETVAGDAAERAA